MALANHLALLQTGLDELHAELKQFISSRGSLHATTQFSLNDECLLEGILSRIWQTWCKFCRSCLFESCMGTVTASGRVITPHPCATTAEHVSGAAIQARQFRPGGVYWGNTNSSIRKEPTWGDVDVLVDIVTRLSPINASQLAAAFSSGWSSTKAIQKIRNASAHINIETMAEVQGLRPGYISFPIGHATHALFWIETLTSDFLVSHAIATMKTTATSSIQ